MSESRRGGLRRRLGANFIWSVINMGSERGLYFVVTMYLARVLGVEAFGVFFAAQTIVRTFWMAVDMGVARYGTREIAKNRDRLQETANPLLGMRLMFGLLVLVVFYCYVTFGDYEHTYRYALYMGGLYLVTNALYTAWVFMGMENFKYMALGSFGSAVIFLLSVALWVHGPQDVNRALLFWAVSFLFTSIGLLAVLKWQGHPVRPAWAPREWLKHFRESLYFAVSGSLSGLLTFVPILLITKFNEPHEVGIFSAAYAVVLTVSKGGVLFQSSFYPVLAESYHNDRAKFKEAYRHLVRSMLALGLGITVAGILLGGPFVRLVLGESYAKSIPVMAILFGLIVFRYLGMALNSTIMATGFHRLQAWATLVPIVLIVLLYAVLPIGDPLTRVALSTVLAEVVFVIVMYLIGRRTYLLDSPACASM